MARLYRYVDSGDESGYYVIGDKGNATFQLTPIARNLFDKLGYDPPTKTEAKGPKVPPELHWTLYEIGWIYTGENESGAVADKRAPIREDIDEGLSDDLVTQIRKFVENREGVGVQKLVEQLDIQLENGDRLWSLDEAKEQTLEDYVYGYMETALTEDMDEGIKVIDVTYLDLSNDIARCSLNLVVETSKGTPDFRHSIFADEESGVSGVVSATSGESSWEERGRLDRHRGHFFEALATATEDTRVNLDFEPDEIAGQIEYQSSFEMHIVTSD